MDGEYLIIPAVPSFPRERSLDNLHYYASFLYGERCIFHHTPAQHTGVYWGTMRNNVIISIIHSFFDYTILYNTNLDYFIFYSSHV